jgi:uncharacterized protein YjdB
VRHGIRYNLLSQFGRWAAQLWKAIQSGSFERNVNTPSLKPQPSAPGGTDTDPLSNLYLFHAGVNLVAEKIQAIAKGQIIRGLILATLASCLSSCGDTVDFGFPWDLTVTSIVEVTPADPSLPIGATQQFTATAAQPDGTSIDVTSQAAWTSSDPLVATVNSSGLASSLRAGTTTISAAYGSTLGRTTLTVTSARLSSISVTPTNPAVPQGFSQDLTATGIFDDGTNIDLTDQVTWSTSNDSVAAVDITGLVTGIGPGTATITAASGSVSGNTIVRVTIARLVSISLSPSDPTIPGTPAGITQQFTATGSFSDGTSLDISTQIAWNSSRMDVATISSSGLATSIRAGFSIITAAYQGISENTTLTVASADLTSISVTPQGPSVVQGATQQFTSIANYADGTTWDITLQVVWRTNNITVVTVDSNGLATAIAPGTATITATSGNIFGSADLTVTP